MKLLELGHLKWRVLAVCDRRDRCQVLELLSTLDRRVASRALNILREYIPERGPDFHNREKVKNLGDGIFSIRVQPGKGPKLRVYFFQSGENVIVATEAFAKRNERTTDFINRAKAIREKYLRDKELNLITIESAKGD